MAGDIGPRLDALEAKVRAMTTELDEAIALSQPQATELEPIEGRIWDPLLYAAVGVMLVLQVVTLWSL